MGKKSQPAQPAAPDPHQVAQASTSQNVATAIAGATLGNANTYGPNGSTEYSINGYETVTDPVNGGTYQVPRYNQTTTLSPQQQAIYDQSNKLDLTLGDVAQHQADVIGGELGTPYQGPGGSITRSVGGSTDYAGGRKAVEDALFARLQPSLDHAGSLLDTKLQNEGFVRGTDEYNRQFDQLARTQNDARLAVTTQGLQEAQGEQGMDIAAGNFGNTATDQQLKQDLAIRNQPINEVSALTNGTQVQLPTVTPYQSQPVANTDLASVYSQNYATQAAMYNNAVNANAQQVAGLYGGIGSLAGAGLYGLGKKA